MKLKKISVAIFVLLLIILNCNLSAFAFSTESLPNDTKNLFLNNIQLEVLDYEPEKGMIECFDVNNSKQIAIGFSTLDFKVISVYNQYGEFQYGYKFETDGMFAIDWNESNIDICFVRSDIVLELTPEGDIFKIAEIKDTTENNSYINNILYSTEQTIDNIKYVIKNKFEFLDTFLNKKSYLIVIDEKGNENIIYTADSNAIVGYILVLFSMLMYFLIIITMVIKKTRAQLKQSGDGPSDCLKNIDNQS